MNKWFRRSIQHQLMFFVLSAVLVPICLLGLVSYVTANHLAKEQGITSAQSSLKQLQTSLEFVANDVKNMSVFLIGNGDVQKYLEVEENPVQQRYAIQGFLSNLTFSKPYVANVVIEPLNDNQRISTLPIVSLNEDKKEENLKVEQKGFRYENNVITLYRPIRSTKDYSLLGYLSIYLDQKVIQKYLQTVDAEWNGTTLLLKDESILASSKNTKLNTDMKNIVQKVNQHEDNQLRSIKKDGEEKTVLSRFLPDMQWTLVSMIPTKTFTKENRKFLLITMLAIFVAILLVIALVFLFIRKVMNPLTQLTKVIQQSDPRVGLQPLVTNPSDEIGLLMKSYNALNDRIASLLEKIKKSEARKREIDLQALQAQINPHFLYNTLASIHWMSLMNKDVKTSQMVSSLSNFLRYSLNKGNEYYTVREELEHLGNYVKIQQMRYPDAFQVKVQMPDDSYDHYILKLVLQPLIENSIVHGLLPNQYQEGLIQVTGVWNQKHLQIIVSDNGVGMRKEKMDDLREQFSQDEKLDGVVGRNYGLRNVNLRLYMHYGAMSTLQMNSEESKGTTITFCIPLERGE